MYAAPTAEDYAKRWDEAVDFFRPILAPRNGVLVSEGVLRFINGARMDWYGLHRFDGVRGNKYHLALVDEAAHARNLEEAWTQAIRPALTDYKGGAWFMSTPKGHNYFKKLCDNHTTRDTWSFHQRPSVENPYLDPGEIEEARLDMSSQIFAQEYLAQFISLQGSRVKREWLQYGATPEGTSTVALGVDLAISQKEDADFTTIVATAKHGDKYYIIDVRRFRGTFNQTQEAIKQMAAKWSPFVIQIEATQYQAAVVQELIRTTTLPVKATYPNKDKVMRFATIEGKFEHGHVVLVPGLPREFEDELLAFPYADHDDQVDALVNSITAHTQTSFAFTL